MFPPVKSPHNSARQYAMRSCSHPGLPAPQYMTEAHFNWRMVKTICTELHVYDEELNYKPFDAYPGHEKNPLLVLLRKLMPNAYTPRVLS